MINVHIIFNAHIDPIWLWPWPAGLDEALATCRSACDRMDAHPEICFTRGEAWIYRQIEDLDPDLFARIQTFVQAGRWEIVGGWWIQPDCNLPSGFGLEQQIRLGKEYFEDRFGQFPTTAYNVDTFGHAAALPRLMHQFGQTQYIMMRPQEHEMDLPARLFRWQGEENGPEVVTFRIAGAYTTWGTDATEHIQRSVTNLPEGIQDTMCFIGVGDHGGGPTEAQIAWLKQNLEAVPGCRLIFSSVTRFFDAIGPQVSTLPLVTGELQHHAIGCYTVHRPVKLGVRHAEHRLAMADAMQTGDPDLRRRGWEYTCFHQFHDTLGGTCLPSAYRQVDHQLGFAQAVADDALVYEMRRRMRALPDSPEQRLVFWNASDTPFEGYVEAEPWIAASWQPEWHLVDEAGGTVIAQRIATETPSFDMTRLLIPLQADPGALRVLHLLRADVAAPVNDLGQCATSPLLGFGDNQDAVRLDLIDDPSDTWSHSIDRYAETGVPVTWTPMTLLADGSLMRSWTQDGTVGRSRLHAEWRAYAGQAYSELRLRVDWAETHKILKLVLPLPLADTRIDGTLGGKTPRVNDGRERPLQNWTLLPQRNGGMLGIVCPDIFACDGSSDRIRLTLLRSAIMAHHDPSSGEGPNAILSDQGQHEFRFEFWPSGDITPEVLEARSLQLQRPPLFADLTRGMRAR